MTRGFLDDDAPRRSDLVDIAAVLKRTTAKAFLVDAGTGAEVWLPKSLVEHDADAGTFAMPEWLAREKGLL